MKRIVLFITFLSALNVGRTQVPTISPLESGEFCPGVVITFTVTLTGTSPSVVSKALNVAPFVAQQAYNINTSSGVTTFNFDGRFIDANNKQTFTVNYTNSSGQAATKDFTFIKIKSLTSFGSGSSSDCSTIQASPTSITAPRCQTGNVAVSFSNIQYSNVFESPVLCYGTVSNYEYLLPNGWSLNSTTSNGSTWIAGDNSETITYDLATGDGGVVRIRPINTACGTNLNKGREVTIPISRPAPVLSITGQDFLCNAGDQTTLTINGLPSGASVSWGVSLPSQLQPLGCTTCTSVMLEKIGSASTTATATATVTHCSFTYTVTKTIKLGAPAGIGIANYNNLDPCPDEGYFQVLETVQPNVYDYSGSLTIGTTGAANTISWALAPGASLNGWTWTASGSTVTVSTKQDYSSLRLRVTATNDCGSINKDYHFRSTECLVLSRIASPEYTVHPNPTKGVFTITLKCSDKAAAIKEIVVKNKVGVAVKQFKYKSTQKAQTVNIQDLPSDVYFVHIFDGKIWVGERIFKE